MCDIIQCGSNDYAELVGIWERSVRATHDFLTNEAIEEIKKILVPEYFPQVELYATLDNGALTGFIGVSGEKIEMLFVDSDYLRQGIGSRLIDFAIRKGAVTVDVNEQNPSALDFYTAKGFRTISRDDVDDAGRPYPILHLSL